MHLFPFLRGMYILPNKFKQKRGRLQYYYWCYVEHVQPVLEINGKWPDASYFTRVLSMSTVGVEGTRLVPNVL